MKGVPERPVIASGQHEKELDLGRRSHLRLRGQEAAMARGRSNGGAASKIRRSTALRSLENRGATTLTEQVFPQRLRLDRFPVSGRNVLGTEGG